MSALAQQWLRLLQLRACVVAVRVVERGRGGESGEGMPGEERRAARGQGEDGSRSR